MDNYIIEKVNQNDVIKIVDIYNSHKNFLNSHMRISSVSKGFVLNEIEEMKNIGFISSTIKDNKGEIVGLCDFKIADEVYLSLLMIDAKLKGNGLGRVIYNQLENLFKYKNASRIRIDVVYGYQENVFGFWKKQGFISSEKIELEWNGYKSQAVKMYKTI
ncbi:GNAT family N-acetyltransferase [Clostridium cagae]|uniref:GNAT family N-acetyltransferase n=1 Tax=Clostridium cagae TaxID=2080751 RepID=UPI003F757C47